MRRRGLEDVSGVVQQDGCLLVAGQAYSSPSGAARSIVKRPINGWDSWRDADGRTLTHLRASLNEQ